MSITDIVNARKCISCGACVNSCATYAISMQYNAKSGFYHPIVVKDLCVGCEKCLKTCPVENRNFSNSLIGPYEGLVLAHAQDQEVRYNATSGGVINSLVHYLISHHIVEGVLMVGYCRESPIESSPYMIDMNNLVLLKKSARDFSSRYVSVPLLQALKSYEEKYRSIAIVGTPCQISAVDLLIARKSVRFEKVYKMGIACSSGMNYLATKKYKRRQCMDDAKMYYRGDGWPGKNSLVSPMQKVEYPHLGSLFERMFSSQIFKASGCRLCTDQFAEEADISFCDFWNAEERNREHEGNSCIIVRNAYFTQVLSAMEAEGYIQKVRILREQEVIETQRSVLNYKKGEVRSQKGYKRFCFGIDMIFRMKLYKMFGIKNYRMICRIYAKLCARGGELYPALMLPGRISIQRRFGYV